jgi:hypothetical protein
MKYDYSKEFEMIKKIPNIHKTFSKLKPIHTDVI